MQCRHLRLSPSLRLRAPGPLGVKGVQGVPGPAEAGSVVDLGGIGVIGWLAGAEAQTALVSRRQLLVGASS